MTEIVTIHAGKRGMVLRELWTRIGRHRTSDAIGDLHSAPIVLLGDADDSVLELDLEKKIIIDCSNPLSDSDLQTHPSHAEILARKYPHASVVKAFNTVTTKALMFVSSRSGPAIGSVYTSGFYCGDDENAKQVVCGLMEEIKLDPVDCGPLTHASILEGLGLLVDELESRAFGSLFALTVVRPRSDTSPLDRWA